MTAEPLGHLPTLGRLALALALGLFVGLERERRGKEAGLRTFGFAAVLGCLGSLLGEAYALVSLLLLGVLVAFLNWQALRVDGTAELTTSVALLVVGIVGVLCGQGYTFAPVVVGVTSAALLAWKESLAGFSLGLTEAELRSAILLAILAFVVYPILPAGPLDAWGLVEPQGAWVTVILIAAIGFANYVLLKRYGARGAALAGFLGGLVNSSVTVTELATRVRETNGSLADVAYRGVLLSTSAMLIRNAALLGLLAPATLVSAGLPLALMLVTIAGLVWWRSAAAWAKQGQLDLRLASPFSLQAALKFGLIFLVLQVVATLAQQWLGQVGFYAISVVGGLVSSASAVAAAAALASHGRVSADVGGMGAVLASLASAVVNLPLIDRYSGARRLTLRLSRALALVLLMGIVGLVADWLTP